MSEEDRSPAPRASLDGAKRFPWRSGLLGVLMGAGVTFAIWRFAIAPPSEGAEAAATELQPAEALPAALAPAENLVAPVDSAPTRDELAAAAPAPAGLPRRSDGELRAKLAADRAACGSCYQVGLAENPRIEGTVVMRFRVNEDGTVAHVTISRSTLGSATVTECLAQVISRWRFLPGRRAETFELDFPFARQ